jgi:hypothetical protein
MKRHTLAPGLGLLLLLAALAGAPAALATKPADLRVQTTAETLTQVRQYSGTTRVPTDPDAECFGPGTGGSGNPLKLEGATALGVVKEASETDDDLRPLEISDFFEFGPAVCAIGGQSAPNGFWYLKVNHVGSQIGGTHPLERGDGVLWFLDPDFSDPAPDELVLRAPARATAAEPFEVRVLAFDDSGQRSPAEGAVVPGGPPTDADGRTMVTLGNDADLQATRTGDIPSNVLRVCVALDSGECPPRHGLRILGSGRDDGINGSSGSDRIRARGGDDVVDARGGLVDSVGCGAGHDLAIVGSNDKVSATCERVRGG